MSCDSIRKNWTVLLYGVLRSECYKNTYACMCVSGKVIGGAVMTMCG